MTPKQAFEGLPAWQRLVGFIIACLSLLALLAAGGVDLLDLASQTEVDALQLRVNVIESNQRVEAHKTERILCIVEALAEDRPTPPGCIR